MIIKFQVDIKLVRQALALIGEDIPSDEEIEKKLSNAVVDLCKEDAEEMKQAALGFVLIAIGQTF